MTKERRRVDVGSFVRAGNLNELRIRLEEHIRQYKGTLTRVPYQQQYKYERHRSPFGLGI